VRQAPAPVRWFIVDCSAITDIDYSAAQVMRDLLNGSTLREISVLFARVNPYMRADMDRHCLTPVIGEARIFRTLHEAVAAVGSDRPAMLTGKIEPV
jgi:MFS superfamily sulfate permease-like transporter